MSEQSSVSSVDKKDESRMSISKTGKASTSRVCLGYSSGSVVGNG